MPSTALFLYAVTVLIWGSTWLAITFQLGEVDPLVSVVYRFALASLLLFLWCGLRRARLVLDFREHLWFAAQGACMFGLNYWLTYVSEVHLTSGVVAVIFATMSFFTMLWGRIFLGRPVQLRMVLGACLGIAGVAALFWPEVDSLSLGDDAVRGALLALGATALASLGGIVATHNVRFALPVISANAWGMFYGTLLLGLIALARGAEFSYPAAGSYTAALLYLSVVGSVLAFGAYLRLIAMIGPERAGYGSTLTPVVALLLSTLFEGYRWSAMAAAGLALIIAGNVLVLRSRR